MVIMEAERQVPAVPVPIVREMVVEEQMCAVPDKH
jgi:hypothetical protein